MQSGIIYLKSTRRLLSAALTILIFSNFANTPVFAEEISICVICNDPGKVYQCSISYKQTGYQPDGTINTPNRQGLQFACIQEIANYGKHGQCGASRQTPTQCGGEPYTLKDQSALYKTTPAATTDETNTPPDENNDAIKEQHRPSLVESTQKSYDKASDNVKKGYDNTKSTVKKGYKKTTSTVKKTVKTVGDSIGSAAKTTYNCLTSWFNKCSN